MGGGSTRLMPSATLELALRFANTVAWHASAHAQESIFSYEDMLRWFEGELGASPVWTRLLAAQNSDAETASQLLVRILGLREVVFRVFSAQAVNERPANRDVSTLEDEWRRASRQLRLTHNEGGFEFQWEIDKTPLEYPLWLLAHSAVELLTNARALQRVGRCADPAGCGWLFLDQSKNRSRRWCDINDCGNRAKQRRFRGREQALGDTP